MGRRTFPSFLVTRITETPDGIRLRVQRLEGATKPTLTNDVRVLHLDQVAIQICRGSVFFVLDRGGVAGRAALYRLEIHADGANGWSVGTSAEASGAEAIANVATFPVLGSVTTSFAVRAVERGWLAGRGAGLGRSDRPRR